MHQIFDRRAPDCSHVTCKEFRMRPESQSVLANARDQCAVQSTAEMQHGQCVLSFSVEGRDRLADTIIRRAGSTFHRCATPIGHDGVARALLVNTASVAVSSTLVWRCGFRYSGGRTFCCPFQSKGRIAWIEEGAPISSGYEASSAAEFAVIEARPMTEQIAKCGRVVRS